MLKGLPVGMKLHSSVKREAVRENSTSKVNSYKNRNDLCPEFGDFGWHT